MKLLSQFLRHNIQTKESVMERVMDSVKKLGELVFSTRLKRLSDRLAKDVSHIYKKLDIDFEARWFTMVSVLKENSPMAITELASHLGITHTAVNQLANELIKKGYINSLKGNEDERQRFLSLSSKGKKLCDKLSPVWNIIKEANKELIDSVDPNLLLSIAKIEDELDKSSIYERVWVKLHGSMPGELKILKYSAGMKKHFQKLNYEWLEEYFTVEEKDKNILLHPKEKIINNGGTIFFALVDDEVAGTCAVIKHPDGKYELAKMAVTRKFQSRGLGSRLLEAAVKWTKKKRASELYLLTNEKLIAANELYKKAGFIRLKNNPVADTQYQRETYAMKLELKK